MKVKLRCLFGFLSALGFGYFIYQGSTNYIVLSLIMFSFSAFVITFANFVINKNVDINMIEKHEDGQANKVNQIGGLLVTVRSLAILIFSIILMCGASFLAGRSSTTQLPVDINQQQTITINQALETFNVSVNINEASIEELKMLDGVGDAKAYAIFNGQPYDSIYDLLSRKIVGEDTFDKIRSVITVD